MMPQYSKYWKLAQKQMKKIIVIATGGTIAGSGLKLNEAVRNFRAHTDLPLNEIVNMASLNPARRVGIADRKGSIEPGKVADFAIADENMQIVRTVLRGRTIFES